MTIVDGPPRSRVGVIFGGSSEEHAVAVKSAREVARHLDPAKYEPFYIGITRRGEWKLCAGPDDGWEHATCRSAVLTPDRNRSGLLVLEAGRYKIIPLDVVLPVLHGRFGEDGAIQGLLELSGIPYVGCDVQSSSICMDKSLAYMVARTVGIATPTFRTLQPDDPIGAYRLRFPVFVKPARSGSSFGVSKVSGAEDLPGAVETARRYDPKVLIEDAVDGLEIGCAILESDGQLIVGEPDHIALTHGFYRIHQESDPEGGSENSTPVVPADIAPESRALVRRTAETLFRRLGCTGLARVDMFLQPDGRIVLNEINTFPGLTSYSRYPTMMAAAGFPLAEVLDRLLSSALAGRHR